MPPSNLISVVTNGLCAASKLPAPEPRPCLRPYRPCDGSFLETMHLLSESASHFCLWSLIFPLAHTVPDRLGFVCLFVSSPTEYIPNYIVSLFPVMSPALTDAQMSIISHLFLKFGFCLNTSNQKIASLYNQVTHLQ